MLRFVARLAGLLLGALLGAAIASALAAVVLRRRAPAPSDASADEIDLVTIMDGLDFASTAPAFRGGRVVCWYAGVNLDLRGATLDPAGARLRVRTAFGATRIFVEPGVPVRLSGPALFGDAIDAAEEPEPAPGTPTLEVSGLTLFGALAVVAAASEEATAAPGGAAR